VQFDEVTKDFPLGLLRRRKVRALDAVSMSVGQGDVYGIIGPNRAGKSTLVKLLLTICRPTSGTIRRFGRNGKDRETLRRVGYVHERQVFPLYLTARSLLAQYGALSWVPRTQVRERTAELLEMVALTEWADSPVSQYSKGMLQRLSLAQALINDPDLLVLDEPTEGLDLGARRLFHKIVRRRQTEGRTSIVVSHHLVDIQRLCNRLLVLREGRVAFEGPTSELVPTSSSASTASEAAFEAAIEPLYAETSV
jgi:ABC-2 type transport system ATP-binding protein